MSQHTMTMTSRNEYLKEVVRPQYLKARANKDKKKQSELLTEAQEATGLSRKYLLEKLRPKSNLDRDETERRGRGRTYGNDIVPALATMWRIFDRPCGQRLVPLLQAETERLRKLGELSCTDAVAAKLHTIGARTVDTLLTPVKRDEVAKKAQGRIHPLLYQQVPTKAFRDQDRSAVGFIQGDLVVHSGRSPAGEFVHTVSTTDIRFGWWEGEAVMGRGQEPTKEALAACRARFPFPWCELHPDNDTAVLNHHMLAYCEETNLAFSHSRAYQKNDNCLVEQKNGTHVRGQVGHRRFDTEEERQILLALYREEMRLYKNFFQPQIMLIERERVGGHVRRRYDDPKTPYRRIMEAENRVTGKEVEEALHEIYASLNPAALKRGIEATLDALHTAHEAKREKENGKQSGTVKVGENTHSVRNYFAEPSTIRSDS